MLLFSFFRFRHHNLSSCPKSNFLVWIIMFVKMLPAEYSEEKLLIQCRNNRIRFHRADVLCQGIDH